MNPVSSSSDNWDQHWANHAEAASTNPAQMYRFERMVKLVSSQMSRDSIPVVVDVGCGTGDLLRRLHDAYPHARFVGIEPSTEGSQISQNKNPGAQILQVDITVSTEADEVIRKSNVVVCSEVLEHLDNPECLVRAISEKSAVGSFLVVSVPGGPRSGFDRFIGHRRHFNKTRLQNLLADSGFSEIKVYRSGFPGFNLYKIAVMSASSRIIRESQELSSRKSVGLATRMFATLMKYSLQDSLLGWQLFATGKKV